MVIQEKCGVSEEERSEAIRAMFVVELDDPTSPQYQAYIWIDEEDGAILCAGDSTEEMEALQQRYILAVFFFALGGPDWVAGGDSWLSSSSECEWFGLTCSDGTRLQQLSLKTNSLSGALPDELFSLVYLTALSLDHNSITGPLTNSIGSLRMLTVLELDDNAMTGEIPSSLYNMTSLKAIDLNDNEFVGGLSEEIGNLSQLMVLQVENNQLTGPLPWFGLTLLDKLRTYY